MKFTALRYVIIELVDTHKYLSRTYPSPMLTSHGRQGPACPKNPLIAELGGALSSD